jgi:simple sugar transport system substrate-binding protein
MKMGADNAAKQLGLDYQYSAAPDETNLGPDYATLLQEAISRHPVAMVVGDFVPTAEDPWIKKATAQGIPVVVVNSGETSWQADGALGFVGEDPYQAGEGAGKAAVEDGIKDLICVDSVPGNPALESRCQGAASAMKAVGGTVTVEDIPSADSTNPAAATEDIQGFVRSHPQADGVLTLGSAYATLALLALKNLGDTAKVKVGTFDVSTANLEAVKSGTLGFLVDQQPFIQGYYSLMMAAQYVAYKVAPTGPIDTGGFIINKTNVDAVLAVQNEYHGLRGAE